MDISKLHYFISIVENGYNISKASRELHISQPALSKYISLFEEEEEIDIFVRRSGRLQGLTPAGENLFFNAKNVVESFTSMMEEFRNYSSSPKGKVVIGIPPLVLTVVSAKVMSKLIKINPTISFEIVEEGAFDLRKKLLLNELDLALILTPTNLNHLIFKEISLLKNELTAFMSVNNKLATIDKIKWNDLSGSDLALYDESFMVRQNLNKKFEATKVKPNIIVESHLWDFMLELTKNSDFITILPSPIANHSTLDDIIEKEFHNPISWEVVLVYPFKKHYTQLEIYTRNSIVDYFVNGVEIQSFTYFND